MATNMGSIGKWIEEHPYATGAIVFGGGLVLLWAFGYLGGGSSGTAQQGTSNLAAAYYAAEAAQTTAGTQLQLATVQANAQQGIATTQANAAVAINAAQQDAMTTLGSQTATTAQTLYNDQLQSSVTSANDAAATALATANYNYQADLAHTQAGLATTAMNTIIPQEMALTGGYGAFSIPGLGSAAVNTQGLLNINTLMSQGYTLAEAQRMAGV